jgi:hypothetical protein
MSDFQDKLKLVQLLMKKGATLEEAAKVANVEPGPIGEALGIEAAPSPPKKKAPKAVKPKRPFATTASGFGKVRGVATGGVTLYPDWRVKFTTGGPRVETAAPPPPQEEPKPEPELKPRQAPPVEEASDERAAAKEEGRSRLRAAMGKVARPFKRAADGFAWTAHHPYRASWAATKTVAKGVGKVAGYMFQDQGWLGAKFAEKMGVGSGGRTRRLKPDAIGTLDDRKRYDREAGGFIYHATDTGEIYIRHGTRQGEWTDGIPYSTFRKYAQNTTVSGARSAVTGATSAKGPASALEVERVTKAVHEQSDRVAGKLNETTDLLKRFLTRENEDDIEARAAVRAGVVEDDSSAVGGESRHRISRNLASGVIAGTLGLGAGAYFGSKVMGGAEKAKDAAPVQKPPVDGAAELRAKEQAQEAAGEKQGDTLLQGRELKFEADEIRFKADKIEFEDGSSYKAGSVTGGKQPGGDASGGASPGAPTTPPGDPPPSPGASGGGGNQPSPPTPLKESRRPADQEERAHPHAEDVHRQAKKDAAAAPSESTVRNRDAVTDQVIEATDKFAKGLPKLLPLASDAASKPGQTTPQESFTPGSLTGPMPTQGKAGEGRKEDVDRTFFDPSLTKQGGFTPPPAPTPKTPPAQQPFVPGDRTGGGARAFGLGGAPAQPLTGASSVGGMTFGEPQDYRFGIQNAPSGKRADLPSQVYGIMGKGEGSTAWAQDPGTGSRSDWGRYASERFRSSENVSHYPRSASARIMYDKAVRLRGAENANVDHANRGDLGGMIETGMEVAQRASELDRMRSGSSIYSRMPIIDAPAYQKLRRGGDAGGWQRAPVGDFEKEMSALIAPGSFDRKMMVENAPNTGRRLSEDAVESYYAEPAQPSSTEKSADESFGFNGGGSKEEPAPPPATSRRDGLLRTDVPGINDQVNSPYTGLGD